MPVFSFLQYHDPFGPSSKSFPCHSLQFLLPQFPLRSRPVLPPRPIALMINATRIDSPSLWTTFEQNSPNGRNLIHRSKEIHHSRKVFCTFSASIQRFHVEDVNALHFAENFETFEAGRLVKVGGDGAGFGAGGKEVIHCSDICAAEGRVSV